MKTQTLRVTDAATEYAGFFKTLKDYQSDDKNHVISVFAPLVASTTYSAPHFRAISKIAGRSDNLRRLIVSLPDDEYDTDLKTHSTDAITRLQGLFGVNSLSQSWQNMISKHITDDALITLRYASNTLKRLHPISVVSTQQLKDARGMLDSALEELFLNEQLPMWAKMALQDGINDLQFAIENYSLFGQDEVVSSFLSLRAKAEAVSTELRARDTKFEKLAKLAIAMIFVSDLICAVPNVVEKLPWWYALITQTANYTASNLLQAPPIAQGDDSAPLNTI